MRRNAGEAAQLVNSEAQGDEDFGVERARRLLGVALNEKIEFAQATERAHDEFGGKSGVARIHAVAETRVKKFGSVSSFRFDAKKNVEGEFAGRGDGHYKFLEAKRFKRRTDRRI